MGWLLPKKFTKKEFQITIQKEVGDVPSSSPLVLGLVKLWREWSSFCSEILVVLREAEVVVLW